jgi:hypothetical protein
MTYSSATSLRDSFGLKAIGFTLTVLFASFNLLISDVILPEYLDSFDYFTSSLQKEEDRFLNGPQSLFDKLIVVRSMHDIILDFLNTADDDKFYEQLRNSKPFIDLLTKTNDSIFTEIYPDRYYDRKLFAFNGSITYIYYNIFHRRNLTEEQRTHFFEEEVNRHKNVQLLPKQFLNKKALKMLVPGQSYNFVLNVQNKAYVSYNQLYRLKDGSGKTILNSPNHTILAGNAPVLSAGVVYFYNVGKKKLFILSCSSGHFHTMPDSLNHMKSYLINLGIPEEAIICLGISYEKIDLQINRTKDSMTSP